MCTYQSHSIPAVALQSCSPWYPKKSLPRRSLQQSQAEFSERSPLNVSAHCGGGMVHVTVTLLETILKFNIGLHLSFLTPSPSIAGLLPHFPPSPISKHITSLLAQNVVCLVAQISLGMLQQPSGSLRRPNAVQQCARHMAER